MEELKVLNVSNSTFVDANKHAIGESRLYWLILRGSISLPKNEKSQFLHKKRKKKIFN